MGRDKYVLPILGDLAVCRLVLVCSKSQRGFDFVTAKALAEINTLSVTLKRFKVCSEQLS